MVSDTPFTDCRINIMKGTMSVIIYSRSLAPWYLPLCPMYIYCVSRWWHSLAPRYFSSGIRVMTNFLLIFANYQFLEPYFTQTRLFRLVSWCQNIPHCESNNANEFPTSRPINLKDYPRRRKRRKENGTKKNKETSVL